MSQKVKFLNEEQENHAIIMDSILTNNFYAIDYSETGAGKTHIASYLIDSFKIKNVIVICPNGIVETWKGVKNKYNLPILDIIPYTTLASKAGKEKDRILKHGLLRRVDLIDDKNKISNFYPTKKFMDLLDDQLLLIADETHHVKNDNIYFKALSTLTREMSKNPRLNRILLLSGTLAERSEETARYMYLLGEINYPYLYTYNKGNYFPYGYQELVDMSFNIDKTMTDDILESHEGDGIPDMYANVAEDLFSETILTTYGDAMVPKHKGIDYNLICDIKDEETKENIGIALEMIKSAVGYNEKDPSKKKSFVDWGEYSRGMSLLQLYKSESVVDISAAMLKKYPNCKVVCWSFYHDSLDKMEELFINKYPRLLGNRKELLKLHGKVPMGDRKDITLKFQKANLDNRVLIINPQVGGEGINLDDIDGGFPRFSFYLPTHRMMLLKQARGRFDRQTTRSIPRFCVVYSNIATTEAAILKNLTKKGEVMKKIHKIHVESGIVFPNDYPEISEEAFKEKQFGFKIDK